MKICYFFFFGNDGIFFFKVHFFMFSNCIRINYAKSCIEFTLHHYVIGELKGSRKKKFNKILSVFRIFLSFILCIIFNGEYLIIVISFIFINMATFLVQKEYKKKQQTFVDSFSKTYISHTEFSKTNKQHNKKVRRQVLSYTLA